MLIKGYFRIMSFSKLIKQDSDFLRSCHFDLIPVS